MGVIREDSHIMDMFDEALAAIMDRSGRNGVRRPKGSDGVFGPPKPTSETPADKTARAARMIIDAEGAEREQRTQRLRAARLARDAKAENG